HPQWITHPIGVGAAVLVVAAVPKWSDESVKEVPIEHELYPVQACLETGLGAEHEVGLDLIVDLVDQTAQPGDRLVFPQLKVPERGSAAPADHRASADHR